MKFLVYIFLILSTFSSIAQDQKNIDWIDINHLDDYLISNKKKTLIFFYADWCVYCKKMEKVAFKNLEVIKKLNDSYFSVKINVETTDTITFGSKKFINQQAIHKRNGIHEFALLLANRKNKKFSLPVILLFDENFNLMKREFNYLSTDKLMAFLNN